MPSFPDNLESLHKEEERIRAESLRLISSDATLLEHLEMIHASLETIYAFTKAHDKPTDDELTIQWLGIRLFNTCASSLKLMLAGYYQSSVMLLRDLLETGFLIDYFGIDRTKIREWRQSTEKQRTEKFSPIKVREALDKHDNVTGKERAKVYKVMCNYGTHPTPEGFLLVRLKGSGEIGPFFDQKFLKAVLEELVKHLTFTAWVFAGHFSNVSNDLLIGKAEFRADLNS